MIGQLLLKRWNKVEEFCACQESPHNVIRVFEYSPSVHALYRVIRCPYRLAISRRLILQASKEMITSHLAALHLESFDSAFLRFPYQSIENKLLIPCIPYFLLSSIKTY